jgi:hypothetical protein
MSNKDIFRQNLLMGYRQHQAILTAQHRPQSPGEGLWLLVPFSGNSSPTQKLTLSQAGACRNFLCWEDPSFSKERISLSQLTPEAEEEQIPMPKQDP